jgi:hypothetical protein
MEHPRLGNAFNDLQISMASMGVSDWPMGQPA